MPDNYPDFGKMTIAEIKDYINSKKAEDKLIELLACDSRKGVVNLSKKMARKLKKKKDIIKKWHKNNKYEENLRDIGYRFIAGVDEAGRGPLAGPVVAAAVILDSEKPIYGLDDSKKLSEDKRNRLFAEIAKKAVIGIGKADNQEIDKYNIRNATFLAMRRALNNIDLDIDYVLVDGNAAISELNIEQKTVIDGDRKINAISAASIIAKVTRDNIIFKYAETYPEYNFKANKGYGTAEHIEALKKYGSSPIHRKSFGRVPE